MNRAYREYLRWNGRNKPRWLSSGAQLHIREFGRCVGVVEGPVDYNNCKPGDPDYDVDKVGPEVNVRWLPTRGPLKGTSLRYGYDIKYLEIVR